MSLEVLRTGPLALVQDAGRPGHAAVGVSPSGAADRGAFAAGAQLVGNDPDRQAAIEFTLGGLSVRAIGSCTVALSGAECPATVDGAPVPWATALPIVAGEVLTLGMPPTGLRSYLSVAGGIAVAPVLGSRSTDLLSGLGPSRLTPGMVLPIGSPTVAGERSGAERPNTSRRRRPEPVEGAAELELLPGPRTDWLVDPAALAGTWTVSPDSNRVGVRLTGGVLARASSQVGVELPSEPLVRGAVQLPPSGQPVIFGADHPTTGGYPVVAVLTEAASDRLAQCRPGEEVLLVWQPTHR